MKKLFPLFSFLGGVCFLASLCLFLLTFWNYDARASVLYFPLSILMFVVWFAAIIKLINNPEVKALKENKPNNPIAFLKVLFKDTPLWLKVIAAASFILGAISFVYIMFTQTGVVGIIDGKQVLHNHGSIIRELSDQEYQEALAIESRQFLGHYLIFFAVGTAILWPARKV